MCGTNLHILGNTTVYEIWETFVYVSLIISHPLDVYEKSGCKIYLPVYSTFEPFNLLHYQVQLDIQPNFN